MTTSGSYDFNLYCIEILESAARKVGALADNESLTNEQIKSFKIILNAMVKAWRSDNIFLWKEEFLTLTMQTSSVVLGDDGFDYECVRNHNASNDNRPISGSNYPTYWKKLETSVAAPWVLGTNYVSISNYYLDSSIVDVSSGRLKYISTLSTVPLSKITKKEFFEFSDENTLGNPDSFYFRRDFVPEIFLYPRPDSTSEFVLEFWVSKFNEDFDSNQDNPDFLPDWQEALINNLAYQIAPSQGIFGDKLRDLEKQANKSKEEAQKLDHETGDLKISPKIFIKE